MLSKSSGCCWWKCKLVQPLWKKVWRFLKKIKMEMPYDPARPLLRICPRYMKILIQIQKD